MPCDTIMRTSVMDLAKLPDRATLQAAMQAAGWEPELMSDGSLNGRSSAWGATIQLGVDGSARIRSAGYATQIAREIAQAYARIATVATVQRFGFRQRGETTRSDGSIELTFTKALGSAGKLGL